MTLEVIVQHLIPELKRRGYRKKRLTWFKKYSQTTILFWLQKSQYSKDVWYYNYCVGFNSFYDHEISSYNYCDIIQRLNQVHDGRLLTASDLINYLDTWERLYSDIQNILDLEQTRKLPAFTTLRAKDYLSTFNP